MRVKSNKALRRSARLARGASNYGAGGIAAAVAGILWGAAGGTAYAQQAAAPAAAEPAGALEEVVVTATSTGVKKLDASYNIVSASLQDIQMANPGSASDVYKLSPGVWPENSGGQTGVNIDLAGFPNGGGDSPYFTTMIQGAPIYGSPFLSFMDNSSFIRMDDTVERVEIVQGGTSAIYGPGQIGATANFILRTGKDKREGSVGVTYGNEGLYRVDLFQGGKVAEGWYGSIGGFYRASEGVRDPQYLSDVGGQLTATLKHDLDNGSIMFWARTLHDHNLWIADFPYVVFNGSAHLYPGFNQLNSVWNSKQLQNFQVPNPACATITTAPSKCFENDDISDGRGADLSYLGSQLTQTLGNGWSVSNSFIFDGGYLDTHAMINNGNPQTLSSYISGLDYVKAGNPNGLTAAQVQASFTTGAAVDPNQSIVTNQVWFVQKKLMSLSDEFRVIKDIGNGNSLTLGVYANHYTMNDNWSLGSNVLITNQPNASPIILAANSGGNTYHLTSLQGIVSTNGGYQILQDGNATQVAGYISDSWKIDRLIVDASARVTHESLSQETTNLSPVQMGTQFDLWDNAVIMPNGTYSHGHANNTTPAFSAGVNYEFTDHMSAYGRVNNGHTLRVFDDVRCQVYNGSNSCPSLVPLAAVQNYEAGFKVQNRWAYVDASVYDKEFQGLAYQPEDINHKPLGNASTYGSTALGLRIVGSVNPFASNDNQAVSGFKITVNGIYEHAHYKDFNGCFVYQDINNNTICGSINGVQLARLPKYQYRLTPSDTQNMSWGTLTEQLTYEYIGEHYQDGTGLNPLGSYYDIGAGIDAKVGENWEFRLLGSNLTNQVGLTEGNARFGGNAVQNSVAMGRSILGREVNLTAKYSF